MEFNIMSIFFIFLSISVIVYLLYLLKFSKRINLLVEIVFLGIYGLVLLIFLFPGILNLFKNFGVKNPISFFIYLSIFTLFGVVFYLYKEKEKQRVEITKLVREIALMNKK